MSQLPNGMSDMTRRRLLVRGGSGFATLIAASGLLAACGDDSEGPATGGSSTASAAATDRGVLAFPVEPTLSVAGFLLTKDRGFFERQGLAIDFTYGATGTENIAAVQSGKAQFTIADPVGLANLVLAGNDFVGIYQYVPKTIMRVFALESSGITDIAQLKGKKVGVSGLESVTKYALDAALATAGLTDDDVELVPVAAQRVPALISGKIDALSAWDQVIDLLEAEGDPVIEFSTGEFAQTPGDFVVTTPDTLEQRPDLVRAFLKALAEGQLSLIDEPEHALDEIVTYLPAQTRDRQSAQAQLDTRIESYADYDTSKPIGTIDTAAVEATEELLLEYGALAEPVDLVSHVTNDFVPQGV